MRGPGHNGKGTSLKETHRTPAPHHALPPRPWQTIGEGIVQWLAIAHTRNNRASSTSVTKIVDVDVETLSRLNGNLIVFHVTI
jgi:hypothetical protein